MAWRASASTRTSTSDASEAELSSTAPAHDHGVAAGGLQRADVRRAADAAAGRDPKPGQPPRPLGVERDVGTAAHAVARNIGHRGPANSEFLDPSHGGRQRSAAACLPAADLHFAAVGVERRDDACRVQRDRRPPGPPRAPQRASFRSPPRRRRRRDSAPTAGRSRIPPPTCTSMV